MHQRRVCAKHCQCASGVWVVSFWGFGGEGRRGCGRAGSAALCGADCSAYSGGRLVGVGLVGGWREGVRVAPIERDVSEVLAEVSEWLDASCERLDVIEGRVPRAHRHMALRAADAILAARGYVQFLTTAAEPRCFGGHAALHTPQLRCGP